MGRLRKHKVGKDFQPLKKEENKSSAKALVIFLGVLMVGSVFGVIFYGYNTGSGYGTVTSKGRIFEQTPTGLIYKQDDKEYLFRYLPEEVENLTYAAELGLVLQQPVFTLVFDPEHEVIDSIDAMRLFLLEESIAKNIYIQEGITKDSTLYTLPVMSCANASETNPILLFTTSTNTTVTFTGGCLAIAAPAIQTRQYLDYMQYTLLGILG